MENQNEIYFHVGTGKTGSTYLQQKVFPKIKGIKYLPTHKFYSYPKFLSQSKASKVLLSREFDRQLEEEIIIFSAKYSNTTPIITFRKHSAYIASQYKRFIKNGYQMDFNSFFNLEDTGYFKIKHLHYKYQIELLQKYFNQPPIILNFSDLKNNPKAYITKLTEAIDAHINLEEINLKHFHTSYNHKQLKLMLKFGKIFSLKKRRVSRFKIIQIIWKFLIFFPLRYGFLIIFKWVPSTFIDQKPLIDSDKLAAIDHYFQKDWEHIKHISI